MLDIANALQQVILNNEDPAKVAEDLQAQLTVDYVK